MPDSALSLIMSPKSYQLYSPGAPDSNSNKSLSKTPKSESRTFAARKASGSPPTELRLSSSYVLAICEE